MRSPTRASRHPFRRRPPGCARCASAPLARRDARGTSAAFARISMPSQLRPLGRTGFSIAPLVLGTNVFGWTVDEPTSFSILDAFVDHGFDAIDTADSYSTWVPGNTGGESETIIGRWLARSPSRRDRVHVLTKVGSGMPANGGRKTLAKRWIQEA